ncbi:MAG: CPBP family intramembrane glutamic endopeptidase [Pseudomonadota bacterium]
METNRVTLLTLFLALIAIAISELCLQMLADRFALPLIPAVGACRVIEISMMTGVVLARKERLESIGLALDKIMHGFKNGLIWSGVFGGAAALGFALLLLCKQNPISFIHAKVPHEHVAAALFFIVAGFIGPVAEEMLFRGFLYRFLRQWGVFAALAGSTFFFALAHVSNSDIPFIQIAGGIVFGLAQEKTNNLITPITIHALGNLAIFSLST